MKLLKARKDVEKKAVVNVIELTDIRREGKGLVSSRRDKIDVQLHGRTKEEFESIQTEIHGLYRNANVSKEEAELFRGEEIPIRSENIRKFKTIYHLLKSKKIEQNLSSSSLLELKVDTSEHSFGGAETRRIGMRAIFDKHDQGVEYLNSLKDRYEDLSLQTTIKT
jgi:ASC-1-like (ASCH) protein